MLASSCGKYLMTQSIGFGAAWPRPQIDASRITCDSSSSSAQSHCGRFHQLRAPSRCRRGTACTGRSDSCSKKRIRLRAASRARVVLATARSTAAEPMKQPCGCSVSKSSGMSASDAGRMPPEAPPGR